MQSSTNGSLRLTWAQITWGISILAIMLASWYDTRVRMEVAFTRLDGRIAAVEAAVKEDNTYSKSEIDLMLSGLAIQRARLEDRIAAMERQHGIKSSRVVPSNE